MLYLGIGAGLFILGVAFIIVNTIHSRKAMETFLSSQTDFCPSQKFVEAVGWGMSGSGIALDERLQKLLFIERRAGKVTGQVVECKDIISSEICEDGASIAKVSRASQLGGAAIGGALFGGAGAVVGALSGNSKAVTTNLQLVVTVNDLQHPVHKVVFIGSETNKASEVYKKAIANARHWQALTDVLIKRAEQAG